MNDGAHFRFDILTETWVGMAPGRHGIGAARPSGLPESGSTCPFCPGHEAETEATVFSLGEPWRVRVVRNRFPITRPDAPSSELARTHAARGAHEVIIESREHDVDLATMTPTAALDALVAWRDRAHALATLPDVRAVQLFRNKGRRSGSSQPHPHAQAIALPFVPPAMARRAAIARRFRASTGRSLLLHTLEEERAGFVRILADRDGLVTYCPYASSRAYTVRLAFDREVPRFAALSDADLATLSRRLPDACRRALTVAGVTDYNVLVLDPPLGTDDGSLTIEIVPRTGGDAGFELATGTSLCVVLPEEAAARMRDV